MKNQGLGGGGKLKFQLIDFPITSNPLPSYGSALLSDTKNSFMVNLFSTYLSSRKWNKGIF